MTIVCWDGKTLAADKQSTNANFGSVVTKIFRVPDGLVGLMGGEAHAMELLEWFRNGHLPEKYPSGKDRDSTADAVFVSKSGEFFAFAGPYGAKRENKFCAFGAGRDYALAAMYLGKNAREAVEVACALDVTCGNGIDALEL